MEYRKVSEFSAVDAAGTEFHIVEEAQYESKYSLGEQKPVEIETLRHLRTTDGHVVQRLQQGEYLVYDFNARYPVLVRSRDPAAP